MSNVATLRFVKTGESNAFKRLHPAKRKGNTVLVSK